MMMTDDGRDHGHGHDHDDDKGDDASANTRPLQNPTNITSNTTHTQPTHTPLECW